MGKRKKLWISMRAVTFASIAVLNACSTEGEGEAADKSGGPMEKSAHSSMSHGEGGEGEGAAETSLAGDDLAYLLQLGLMRGHLLVGHELYQTGHGEHAKTHMKHPRSELYAGIESALASRGASGFANELEHLAKAVENDEGSVAVARGYAELMKVISRNETRVEPSSKNASAKLKLAVALLRVAGEEYAIAVVDGKMQNAHEYQDAFGFTRIARGIVSGLPKGNAKEKASEIISALDPLWPSLIPPETLSTEAGQLYGAASQIEILALGLE